VGLLRPIALRLSKMQDQKSLMHCRRSVDYVSTLILGHSYDVAVITFGEEGG